MPINVVPTPIPGVLILEPQVFADARGWLFESYNAREFQAAVGELPLFVQENESRSRQNVLRGVHYQLHHPQGKLVRVLSGAVFDVAVDLRRSSPTFGRWVGVELSADNRRQLWMPPGFGHGFLVRSASADVFYKTTDFWYREHDRTVAWDDPAIGIDWGLTAPPILAPKDEHAPRLADSEAYD